MFTPRGEFVFIGKITLDNSFYLVLLTPGPVYVSTNGAVIYSLCYKCQLTGIQISLKEEICNEETFYTTKYFGLFAGVTRHVGEALGEEVHVRGSKIVALGIAPWGVVQQRNMLIGIDVSSLSCDWLAILQ